MLKQILFIVLSSIFCINAQFNKCPASPVMTDFDAGRYVGKWYQIAHYSVGFEDNLKCVYAEYTAYNSSIIQVLNTGLNQVTNQNDKINGYAYIPNSNVPNHLLVVLKVPVAGFFFETTGKYDVWATDYSTYSLVYSCQTTSLLGIKIENVFILSRTKTLDENILNNLKGMLAASGFNLNLLNYTPQDC